MKKSLLILIVLASIFLMSCQKFESVVEETTDTTVDNPTAITKMSDLVISDEFDWSMIKTLDVQVRLPEGDKDRILYIFSQDGKRLYYKGHPEDGSNVLKTKVTVPTYESALFLKYGTGDNYPEIGAYLSGTNLNFDLNDTYKKGGKHDDDDECTGCDAKLADLTLQYKGSGSVNVVVYNEQGNKAGPGDEAMASVTSVSNGDTFRFFTTDTKGFNSEITVFVNGVKHVAIHVSCSQPIYVGQVFGLFEIVAGKDKNGGVLRECDGTIPDPECGECDGGLTSLSVRYQGSETDATIRVYEDKVQSSNLIHTENNVNNGDEFTITNSGDKMHPKVRITINGSENYTEMHTSCSSGTVEVGDVVDDFLVIAGISKDGGDLCGSVPDPDPDPDPTCEDGSYDMTTFGGFTFEFIGVTENINGTSTWTYTVTGDNPVNPDYKNLYHWALALCEDEHTVIEANYNGHESYNENYLNFYGIKWDQGIDKENGVKTFSFTLDDQYDVVPVIVGFKNVDGDLFYCEIYGPSCEGDPDPDPDPELFGNIAFEDLWPGKGDYDLNDLVIEYDFAVTKDNNEYVESITATFEVRCFGAGLQNGFGFTFPNVDRNDIVSVIGYDIVNTTAYSLGSNGTENGQSKATFILYDDTYRLMQHPGSGTGVNTEHPHPYVTPVTLTMNIVFAEHAVLYSQLDIGNFNPFIVKNQDRDIEIHLPNYPPTDLASSSYFGVSDDDTNPSINKYYLTENNLPWAIMIPERFDYPVEFQSVLGAYNHFAEWAQGDGITYADWYQDLFGYRNESVIY